MKKDRNIIITEDGSSSIYVETLDQSYHSIHGALAESQHIFIKDCLEYFNPDREVNILEIGFGTGLNALLSLAYARKNNIRVNYFTVEKYPLTGEEYLMLNYASFTENISQSDFEKLHLAQWGQKIPVFENFVLTKALCDIRKMELEEDHFEVVYFDAFSPDKQPELWTEEVFRGINKSMKKGGILTSYSVKGNIKRALKASGFSIEKIPGPKGKREILRAQK